MEKEFITPQGKIKRKVTAEELNFLAAEGDLTAKQEVTKEALKTAVTTADKIDLILEHLNLK